MVINGDAAADANRDIFPNDITIQDLGGTKFKQWRCFNDYATSRILQVAAGHTEYHLLCMTSPSARL